MTEEKQGAAEWLRGIIEEYEADRSLSSCSKMAELIVGIECKAVTCRECQDLVMTAIADRIDAERALPEGIEWPRFEDGELVKVGDTVGSDEPFTAKEIAFESERWLIKASSRSAIGCFHGAFGEPVKRPTPKVLDADGAPIEVGDTVYLLGENGEPKAGGVPLAVISLDCQQQTALLRDVGGGMDRYGNYSEDFEVAEHLTHRKPDSWVAWDEDLEAAVESGEVDKAEMMRRAKALAKAGDVE